MKIGISFNPYGSTYGRYGIEKFAKLKQHGYDAVDYNLADTNTELYHLNEQDLIAKIHAEKEAVKAAGITIFQVHGPWHWPPTDDTEGNRQERLKKMKRAVLITSLLDCKHLVIHPIMPYGTEDLDSGEAESTWALNVSFFTALVEYAERYDVTICIENMPMPAFSIATPEKVLELVKTINKDLCKVCLDTGHVAVFPELSVGNEVRRLGDHLKVMHIHDNMGDHDAHLYPSKGIIDWGDFIKAVNEIGYTGVLSLETSPPGNLEDDAFEKESIHLCKIFREIILP